MPLFFRPGQQLKRFTIYRKDAMVDTKGRVVYKTDLSQVGTFLGTVAQASQTEQLQWSQVGHPITHTVVVRGVIDARAEDYIELGDGRTWFVQGKHDPVELSFFQTLYCEERKGVGK